MTATMTGTRRRIPPRLASLLMEIERQPGLATWNMKGAPATLLSAMRRGLVHFHPVRGFLDAQPIRAHYLTRLGFTVLDAWERGERSYIRPDKQ